MVKEIMKEERFTSAMQCGHCANKEPMKIVASYFEEHSDDPQYGSSGFCYELIDCPACHNISLRKYGYDDRVESDADISPVLLYPLESKKPIGLPSKIAAEYEEALKVRNISPNAYAVLIGRVLEFLCEDRRAAGETLFEKLKDLVKKKEIPEKLIGVADKLRGFRNVGAHAALGDLSPSEIPILDDLCNAILEYVYSAPYLVEQAEEKLRTLKKKKAK